MPRVLILDIDGGHYTLLPATTGRGGLSVEEVRTWDDDRPFQPSNAEAQGRAFKDRLASLGIAAAPLVISIGRDRLVLKEIKHPPVPAHEEPAIVRFQALKELTDAGDDIVIDYQPRGDAVAGDKRALVVAVKRDVLRAAQAFAQAAGLKLQALLPRAYGILAAVRAATPPPDPSAAVATIAIGTASGEFLVGRGDQLLFSRAIAGPSLATDAALLSEVRRNLAVHNSQSPQSPVNAVYIAEGSAPPGVTSKLRETLAVPVHSLDPLAGLAKATGAPGESAAAVGVARLLNAARELPINFVKPREPKPPVDPQRRPLLIGAGIVAAVIVLMGLTAYWQISSKDKLLTQLMTERNDLDAQLATLEPDKRRAKALDDWLATQVVWLDELYDLAARFQDVSKLRLVELKADPVPAAGKSKYVGRIQLKGLATSDPKPLEHLTKELVAEGTYRVEPKSQGANSLGIDRGSFPLQFTLRFDVERRPPGKFTRSFIAEPPPKRKIGDFNFLNLLGGGQ